MQLDPRFQERIAIIVTVTVGILSAIMLGKMTAQGQTSTIALIAFGVIGIASVLHFRERVWVVIPVLWPFYGAVQILPLPFALKDLGVMAGLGTVIVCIALKIIRRKPTFTYLDALLYLNAIWLIIVLVRNPVGFLESDSERVGGRPYVSAFFGTVAYWTLSRLSAPIKTMRRVPLYAVSAVGVLFLINVAMIYVPAIAVLASTFYSGFSLYFVDGVGEAGGGGVAAIEGGIARYEFFRDIGFFACLYLCAYFSPPTLLNVMQWRRSLAFFAAMAGLLLSGFRSFLVYAGAIFLMGSYFRKGWSSVLRSSSAGVLAVFLLLLGHGTLYNLPFAAQRAFAIVPSFLRPSQLDENAILAGESSTDWRVEMWILALTTDRYITNKVLGDGFGMTKMQLNAHQRAARGGNTSHEEGQEHMAIAGDFHSGPVSTIRVVGYVGLVFLYLLLIPMAFKAVKLIRRARGSPLFAPTLFFCMPIVFEPFWFTFIFGAFSIVFPFLAYGLGMMKLIENSIEEYESSRVKPLVPAGANYQLQAVS